MTKRIAILGSTGSIGTQTLDVIRNHKDKFTVEVLTANDNDTLLIEQAKEFLPNAVVIANEDKYLSTKEALKDFDIKVFSGNSSIEQIVSMDSIDIVVGALVGYAGLKPTINAINAGKTIALANKETLVVAGEIMTDLAKRNKVLLLPVDSEHSAIFQCIYGELPFGNGIDKIFLTASGGPFRGLTREQLANVTLSQALKHPNWCMGAKVTIDSASLMNKGLEVIEAKWLFNLKPDQIDVVVHPQSIIHSAVQFIDGSIKAQLGLPDMKLPIQFALGFPQRLISDFPRFHFFDYPQLTFEKPNLENFPNLALAFHAMRECGNLPCIMNAANEIAVEAFLKNKIGFNHIPVIIESTMSSVSYIKKPDIDNLVESNIEARNFAASLIK